MPKSELQMLRALLSMPIGKLTHAERGAFQGMYDLLATGRQINLSKKQKVWVLTAYDKHDLDKERAAVKPVEVKDKALLRKS